MKSCSSLMRPLAHQGLADGLARVVGERGVEQAVAEGERLLGGPALQLEAARLHAARDPVEDVGEGEGLELAARSSRDDPRSGRARPWPGPPAPRARAGPPGARPCRETSAGSRLRRTRQARARARAARPGGRGRRAPAWRPSASSASKMAGSSRTRACGPGVVGGVLVDDAARSRVSMVLRRAASGRAEAAGRRGRDAGRAAPRCPRGRGTEAGPAARRGPPACRRAAARRAAARSRAPSRRRRRPGRRSPSGQSISTSRLLPQHWAQMRLALGRTGAPALARLAEGTAASQCAPSP